MSVDQVLSGAFVDEHPEDVAAILEAAAPEESVGVLARCPVQSAAAVLLRMDSLSGAGCLVRWPTESVAPILAELPADSATRMLRAMGKDAGRRLLDLAEPSVAEILDRSLRYPRGTAGARMDPSVFTLPTGITAREAQRRIRRAAGQVRNYVFVVDRSLALCGVLGLRDLILAPAGRALEAIMRPVEHRVSADAPLAAIAVHPGWQRFQMLPVVDREGRLVGVVRRTALEQPARPSATARAVGPGAVGVGVAHLFWTMAAALLDPLFAAPSGPQDGKGS